MTEEEYGDLLEETVAPFFKQPVTSASIALLTQAVENARDIFLKCNQNYVAPAAVSVTRMERGKFRIYAPVCTKAEMEEKKRIDEEIERIIKNGVQYE